MEPLDLFPGRYVIQDHVQNDEILEISNDEKESELPPHRAESGADESRDDANPQVGRDGLVQRAFPEQTQIFVNGAAREPAHPDEEQQDVIHTEDEPAGRVLACALRAAAAELRGKKHRNDQEIQADLRTHESRAEDDQSGNPRKDIYRIDPGDQKGEGHANNNHDHEEGDSLIPRAPRRAPRMKLTSARVNRSLSQTVCFTAGHDSVYADFSIRPNGLPRRLDGMKNGRPSLSGEISAVPATSERTAPARSLQRCYRLRLPGSKGPGRRRPVTDWMDRARSALSRMGSWARRTETARFGWINGRLRRAPGGRNPSPSAGRVSSRGRTSGWVP